eukprot:CAMPEP_0172301060 /NCGR_PEP_ID=MMETSP1058-20130122/3025_1 /TAXON_ID=83371 /ORGANISM="Detonula confervacea, Strain CCMP 353" /LENGTH=1228 /DNA_ID=CAMNT_0013011053 /DNA_START=186 /DNA_END=3872 /DNA_ORIENTATION=+
MAKVSEDSPASEEHPDEEPMIKDSSQIKDEPSSAPSSSGPPSNMPTSTSSNDVSNRQAADNNSTSDDNDELAALIDEDTSQEDYDNKEKEFHHTTDNEQFELADIVEIEIQGGRQSEDLKPPLSPLSRIHDPAHRYSAIAAQTARLANEAKNDRVGRRLSEISSSSKTSKESNKLRTTSSLNEDVAHVDRLLIRISFGVVSCWVALVVISYWIVPSGSIQWYEGTERNAAFVELSILSTVVILKYFPFLWEMNCMGSAAPPSLERGGQPKTMMMGRTKISGILAGGFVVQIIAIMTMVIMVSFPVPVMIDPILGSRVHFIRWCEWVPLAGYMTLMTECIDAPEYDGDKFTQPWKTKLFVAGMQSLSTFCGLVFPFCTNLYVWLAVMILSCVTFSVLIFRYFEKRRLFKSCVWKGGGSVDEIELYQRASMSLALHGTCCTVWSLLTLSYFVTSAGHLFVPESWAFLHDHAATMIGECCMDLVAKCLYMALIIEAHHAAFDEATRADRRLAELRNTMGVVWENSSDTIAISVQKMSGNITSMISPSFFRSALLARQQQEEDISAIVLEHRNIAQIKENELPDVGIQIIRKADFASVNLHAADNNGSFERLGRENETMTSLVVAFTDMLARAWQIKSGEVLFEHNATLEDGSVMTKFEVKVTRLEENAVVVVVRNVSERYRRFEAEKRFVFETTARQKDAEANRFTRHEVKNGLLAAIEICGNIREQMSGDISILRKENCHKNGTAFPDENGKMENMAELDMTLHEVLDIVLAETMARDVIHGMYVPRMERVDVNYILAHTRGFKAINSQMCLVCNPSPLPILLSDQGLFKCIHGNAIRNALKYGRQGGKINTHATYNPDTGEFEMKIINLPGLGHEKLVAMGSRASELVFSHATRLHKDSDLRKRSHSAGDGAWIIRKCANILGGKVEINFEEDRTVFQFRAPVKVHDSPSQESGTFHLPKGVWGIGIDDSKIQRKLLRRFFHHAGVEEPRQVILGQNAEEISGFVDFVVNLVNRHPGDRFFLIADENLEMDDAASNHETISGSECIKQIRNALDPEQEMQMLALVRSANDSPPDLALYKSRAHGYMPKVPLRGISVRETVSPLWRDRFPRKEGENQGDDNNSEGAMSRINSIENLRDLTLITPVEVMAKLEQIDSLCVRSRDNSSHDRWPVLWDKLHQLKGDLQSVNVEGKFSSTINTIEALKGDTYPPDFMSTWLRIRSDVLSFIYPN